MQELLIFGRKLEQYASDLKSFYALYSVAKDEEVPAVVRSKSASSAARLLEKLIKDNYEIFKDDHLDKLIDWRWRVHE